MVTPRLENTNGLEDKRKLEKIIALLDRLCDKLEDTDRRISELEGRVAELSSASS